MASNIILPSELDVSKINFGDIKNMNSNGGKIIYMNYSGANINIQTPELKLPFDVSEFKEGEIVKYTATCALENYKDDKNMKEFYEKLRDIDTHIKKFAKENSVAVFKKSKISDETIDELYNPIVKFSKDPNTGEDNLRWPPNLKVKMKCKNGEFDCKMYDSKKTKYDLNGDSDTPNKITELLVKGTRCKMLIQCSGIWIINGKFGCTWRVIQARLNVPNKDLDEYAFRETEDDVKFVESESDESDESDDDDDDSDDDSEEEEAPKKSRKAKTSK